MSQFGIYAIASYLVEGRRSKVEGRGAPNVWYIIFYKLLNVIGEMTFDKSAFVCGQ